MHVPVVASISLVTVGAVGLTLLGMAIQRLTGRRTQPPVPRQAAPAGLRGLLQLTRFIDGVSDGVVIGDLKGNITHWNPAALRLHGFENVDEVRHHLSEFEKMFVLTYPDDRVVPFDEWPMRKVIRGETVRDYEVQLSRPDKGERFVVRYTCVVVRVADDEDEQVVITLQDVTELRRASRELQLNETRFRQLAESKAMLAAIVEHSEDPIIGKSLDGTVTTWNRAAERVFGYRADEAIGKGVTLLLPPDRHQEEAEILARVRNGHAIENYETKRLTKDGRLIDVSLTISPFRDAAGRVTGASKIVRDITVAKRDAQALRTSHSLLDAVVEGITDPVYVKDLKGRYLLANSALAAALDRPASEVIGATDEEIIGVEHARPTRDADRRILASEIPQTYEDSIETDAGLRHYLTTKAPFYDADHRLAGLLGISRDITARKWTEQALQSSEKRLRGVLDSLLVYVAVLGQDGKLTALNRAAKEVFASYGVTLGDVEDVSLFDTPIPGMSSDVRRTLMDGIGQAQVGQDVRLDAIRLFEGPPLMIVDLALAPVPGGSDASGPALIVSAVDVTRREVSGKQAQDRQSELAHLERVRTMGQMAAGLAHELNQPLGAITNYAGACQRLLSADRMPAERLAEVLKHIQSEALRTGAIVHRLRGFVKKQSPQAVHADPNTLVEEAIRLLSFDLRNGGVEPRVMLAEGLPRVLADPVQIGQVLINLIRNSLDAMGNVEAYSRYLSIQTESEMETGGVQFTVRDRGTGATAEELSRLFDAFYTTKEDGLGIGLSLCRTIIEDHGGHLSADHNPGGGLALSFNLLPAANRTTNGVVS